MIATSPKCPWCSGTGKTARLVFGDAPTVHVVLGLAFRVDGCLMDRPCKRCGGSGDARPVSPPEQTTR
jgi:hypothetical protein